MFGRLIPGGQCAEQTEQRVKPPRLSFKARDIPGLVLVAIFLGGFLYVAVHPQYAKLLRHGNNFGPEWQCTQPGRGGPSFCVKKSLLDPSNQAKAPN
jgi:hypothetical protein